MLDKETRTRVQRALDIANVKTWMCSKNEEVVGRRMSGHACPLHTYLSDQGVPERFVGGGGITFRDGYTVTYQSLKQDWAGDFVMQIDSAADTHAANCELITSLYPDPCSCNYLHVTGSEACSIIESLEKTHAPAS